MIYHFYLFCFLVTMHYGLTMRGIYLINIFILVHFCQLHVLATSTCSWLKVAWSVPNCIVYNSRLHVTRYWPHFDDLIPLFSFSLLFLLLYQFLSIWTSQETNFVYTFTLEYTYQLLFKYVTWPWPHFHPPCKTDKIYLRCCITLMLQINFYSTNFIILAFYFCYLWQIIDENLFSRGCRWSF